jgi:hypothetical protein
VLFLRAAIAGMILQCGPTLTGGVFLPAFRETIECGLKVRSVRPALFLSYVALISLRSLARWVAIFPCGHP